MFLLILKLLGMLSAGILLRFLFVYVSDPKGFIFKTNLLYALLAFAVAIAVASFIAFAITNPILAGFGLLIIGFLCHYWLARLNKIKG